MKPKMEQISAAMLYFTRLVFLVLFFLRGGGLFWVTSLSELS